MTSPFMESGLRACGFQLQRGKCQGQPVKQRSHLITTMKSCMSIEHLVKHRVEVVAKILAATSCENATFVALVLELFRLSVRISDMPSFLFAMISSTTPFITLIRSDGMSTCLELPHAIVVSFCHDLLPHRGPAGTTL